MHCAHPSCTCRVQPGHSFGTDRDKPYCSDACAHAEHDAAHAKACVCGHPGCEAPVNPAEREVAS